MDVDHDHLFIQQFVGVDCKLRPISNFLMDLEPGSFFLGQLYSMDLEPEPLVTILLDLEFSHLLFNCSDGLDDMFEPVGPSLSCLDLRDQQLPRVFLLAFIHRPAGTVRLDWLFCPLSDDLDVELICRILLFPIGLPRLLQLPSITDYVALEHRHHMSVIPARVSIVCL